MSPGCVRSCRCRRTSAAVFSPVGLLLLPTSASRIASGDHAGLITQVDRTVRDLDVSVAFYHDVLGLPFVVPPTPWFEGNDLARGLGVEPPVALRIALFEVGDGPTWFEILQYRSPASRTERALPQSDVGAAHVAFHVDDIEATYRRLTARGVTFRGAPHLIHRHESGVEEWMAFFDDLDGKTLALMSQVRPPS